MIYLQLDFLIGFGKPNEILALFLSEGKYWCVENAYTC